MLYKIIIVDDEPLIQLGLSSILDYSALNIEIVGTCSTGQEALSSIRSLSPELVLMDINIPGINGLEVMEIINKEFSSPPKFIILSCHNEFVYAQRAIKLGAADYLLKDELNASLLTDSLKKAIASLPSIQKDDTSEYSCLYTKRVSFLDNFFMKLLNNWFDSTEKMKEMMSDFRISFPGDYYVCVTLGPASATEDLLVPQSPNLLAGLCNLIHELCKKHCNCYVIPWDSQHFAMILGFSEPTKENPMENQVIPCLQNVIDMIFLYQNKNLFAGVGSLVTELSHCSQSFSESLLALRRCQKSRPITLYQKISSQIHPPFNIGVIRKELTAALDNYDINGIRSLLNQVLDLLEYHTKEVESAIAICSNIIHFADISYKGSEHLMENIFKQNDSYYTLYHCKTISQTVQWFQDFINQLCIQVKNDFDNKKNWLLPSIKKYIEEHYNEPISLTDISEYFNISTAYISSTFKKNNGTGFSECVTQARIKHAKQLLLEPNLKIYDVAYKVGFSDPYYFSKVFKKHTGYTPREYIIHKKNEKQP